MVTGREQASPRGPLRPRLELEEALEAKGDAERLAAVRASPATSPTVHYVRQGDPLGLGHAVLCAAQHVGDEPFAVLLGDDLIDPRDPLLDRMIAVRERHGGSVVALMEVPARADPPVRLRGGRADRPRRTCVRVTDLVEKPESGTAPSNLAVIGRYVLDPAVFEVLRETAPGPRRRDPAHRRAADAGRRGPEDGGGVTGSCSAAGATTPATSSTTCRPSSGSPASGPTSARSSCPGCDSSSPRSPRRADADVADAVLQPGSPAVSTPEEAPRLLGCSTGTGLRGADRGAADAGGGESIPNPPGSRAPAAEPRCRPAREALRRALVRARGPAPRARPPAPGPVPARVRARSLGSLLLLRSRGRTR